MRFSRELFLKDMRVKKGKNSPLIDKILLDDKLLKKINGAEVVNGKIKLNSKYGDFIVKREWCY